MGEAHVFKRGDQVQTWFDTGAFGAKILYGVVITAGRKVYFVQWESGLTNRIKQGDPGVTRRESN
jgi:hypothetical protein